MNVPTSPVPEPLRPRNIDHVVLPVPSLEVARSRYEQLGFSVNEDARHDFGSENACIFFENGTYLEPLAIGHRETIEEGIRKGNNFLSRDAGYRFRHGDDGFSMVCFAGENAKSGKRAFREAGWRTGKIVTVRRPGVEVRAIFALDERAPDISLFRCERPDGPPHFPSELTSHVNGARKLATVTLFEEVPSDFQYYLQTVAGQRHVHADSFGIEFKQPNGSVEVFNRDGMKVHYGADDMPKGRGLRAAAIDIQVNSLDKTMNILEKNSVQAHRVGGRLVVPPAAGQGYWLAFCEAQT